MIEKLNLHKNEPQITLSILEKEIEESTNIGNKRMVKKIETSQGTFFLKEIQSSDEVSSLVNLQSTGISEKSVDINEKYILIKETVGISLDVFRHQVNAHDPDKIDTKSLELVNIDILTKGFYQNVLGIAHQDIKIDNIMINENNEATFIDYGESRDILSPKNDQEWSYSIDQLKILENVSEFMPEADLRYTQLKKEMALSEYKIPEVIDAVFDYYKDHKVSFEKRP